MIEFICRKIKFSYSKHFNHMIADYAELLERKFKLNEEYLNFLELNFAISKF